MTNLKKNFNQSLRYGMIDKTVLYSLINLDIQNENIFDYVNEVSISLNGDGNSYYQTGTKKVHIESKGKVSIKYNKSDLLKEYKKLLTSLYHELWHAKQLKTSDEYLKDKTCRTTEEELYLYYYTQIIEDSLKLSFKKRKYAKEHDLYPVEHEANYIAEYKSLIVLSYLSSCFDRKTIEEKLYEKLLKDYIFKEDRVISPYEQLHLYFKDYFDRKKLIDSNTLSTYKRLKLGLPVNNDILLDLKRDLDSRKSDFYKNVIIL